MIKNDIFDTCDTVKKVKTLYRELARATHPDLGGNTAEMQKLNRFYKMRLSSV